MIQRSMSTTTLSGVDEAILRARAFLLSSQAPDGYWVGELEADTTITSEYLLLTRLLGKADREREAKAARYILSRQLPEGGWNLYQDGPSDLSASIKAYFALKLTGLPADHPAMAAAATHVRERGGPTRANVFTKITLALFGEYDWSGVPAMPAEIMLLPRWSYFNLHEISYWSRTVLVPLLVLMDKKPVVHLRHEQRLDELWPVPRERASLRFQRWPRPFSLKALFWKNFFIAVDDWLKLWERIGFRPLRERAVEAARKWLEERLVVPGGLGGIYPAMANSVLALRALGYPDDHPLIQGQLKEIEALAVEEPDRIHYQPCVSPVWDTALAANALIESGLTPDHPSLRSAADWLIGKQILTPGDWQAKRPKTPPGGWPFQYGNDFYPDLDDTAMAVMALAKIRGLKGPAMRFAIDRGVAWLLGMQGRDGGWGSFDADNDRLLFNNIPFADHGALLDPSTEDLTGRGLEMLGTLGHRKDFSPARRGIDFIKRAQRPEGCWYGRWGVNYIYGTWSVLRGLQAIGEDLSQEYVRRAVRWLESRQNPDGGWGESCGSYDDPTLAGVGPSAPSQTAWALLGLFAAGSRNRAAVERGISYLVETQRHDGSWVDLHWNGAGFPRVFYLKYHLYSKYFPLWALGVHRGSAAGRMTT
jgi:squalene-hopene/tetraprenyl-beta-curcumene cyclase